MTTANGAIVERPTPSLPAPSFVGQATAIEQSRAVEEVRAAIVVAQMCPRNVERAQEGMRFSSRQRGLAERAFYAYPRGGQTVSGPSIHLARELARNWGNLHYSVQELRRDDEGGFSEMQAFAWDLETNTRAAHIFVVPHMRDKTDRRRNQDAPERLISMRDIYENNANAGARRLREAIFSVLPPWFTEEAKTLCHATIAGSSGAELDARIDRAVKAYAKMSVTQDQLEAKVGKPREQWTGDEFAQLDVLYSTLRRNEITKEEAFPAARPSTEALIGEDYTAMEAAAQRAAEAVRREAPREDRVIGHVVDAGTGRGVTLVAESPAESQAILEAAGPLAPEDDPWAGTPVAEPGSGGRKRG